MKEQSPPRWASRFLRWYCHPNFLEEIEGDIYELFERRLDSKGLRMANYRFVWDVLRFFRWSNIKKSNSKYTHMNRTVLFKNYLKLGLRNIQKNVVSASINIVGLAIAIGLSITTFVFVDMQLNMDTFHKNKGRIYQITNYLDVPQQTDNPWGNSPFPLGPQIKEDIPGVESYARVEHVGASVRLNNDVFGERITFVDPSFMEMFSFPVRLGDKMQIVNKHQMVISHEIAEKYFSYEDPIGKELSMKFSNGKILRFSVGAVLDKFPYNSSLGGDFFLAMDNFFDLGFSENYGWSSLNNATFIMLKEGEDLGKVTALFDKYQRLQNESQPDWKVQGFEPISLEELSIRDYQVNAGISGGGQPASRIALIVIALFLLGMACFNFMNIAVASSTKRLKEIALRKVMGGKRTQLIYQFLTENLLLCLFALIFGTVLAYFVFIPGFDYLVPQMEIKFRTTSPFSMVTFYVLLLTSVGLLSGAYPSFYISHFEPTAIFKGNQKFGSKNTFSKVTLGLQFFLATMTIVACFVMTEQSLNIGDKDWGYDPTETLSVELSEPEQYQQLKAAIDANAEIIAYTSSSALIGGSLRLRTVTQASKKISAINYGVSSNYVETMQLRLLKGRSLSNNVSDQTNVIVNETFVEQLALKGNPIDQVVTIDSIRYHIVGVVEDFHHDDFFEQVRPVIINGLEPSRTNFISIRAKSDQLFAIENSLQDEWRKIAPNDPFESTYQEDIFSEFYYDNNATIIILLFLSGFAIILACLGLYGLLSFSIHKKLKEFSIRKVLGATPTGIAKMAANQYSLVILIAFVLGAPLGAVGMTQLAADIFPDSEAVTALPFIVAVSILLVTLLLTVVGQILKAVKVNPADILRSE